MSASAINMDSQIKYYQGLLNETQKRALLSVAKAYAREEDTTDQQRELIRAEREKYLKDEGESYTPEEVRKLAMNKSSRHAL